MYNIYITVTNINKMILYIATKPQFGSCQARVWQLPNLYSLCYMLKVISDIAANPSWAAATPEFCSSQTLPNQRLAAAKLV